MMMMMMIIYHLGLYHHHRHLKLNKKIFFQLPFPPQQTTPKQTFFGPVARIPSALSTRPLPLDNYFSIDTKLGGNVIVNPENVIENIDNALNEVPEPPEKELGHSLINVLSKKGDEILQDDYINGNVLNEKIN